MNKIRVRDMRNSDLADLIVWNANDPSGGDGRGIVVVYDDDPDTSVSTGSDYFEIVTEGPG